MEKILIIDDEASICSSLEFALEDGYDVYSTTDPANGVEQIKQQPFDLCLLDLRIGDVDGIELLEEIKKVQADVVVIMITAYGTISSSVEAVQKGAYSYLTKPINIDELYAVIDKALEFKRLNDQVEYLKGQLERKYRYEGIVGQSPKMESVFRLIEKVKDVDTSVLIVGESGTGKELVARSIHFSGKRSGEHFEVVNCAAIPEHLLESELFGYEKGAFTGATGKKEGKFELANHGTIFLDEIGDMPLALQVKLLRVLQRKEVTPLGSTKTLKLDVRVIAATNKDLKKAVEKGEFREDLYFRLNVIEIGLPPLRERKEDIEYLIQYFIKEFNESLGKEIKGVSAEAKECLLDYEYPGNIRELGNTIEAAIVISDGPYIEVGDLPAVMRKDKQPRKPPEDVSIDSFVGLTTKEVEKQLILATLEYNNGHRRNTAEMLGISERNLREKLKLYQGQEEQ
ncbi:sigma-54-dependent transcriptional regulator [Desertibacillus haloalkaliphilus]|uniref:sigma-54-dependent transcriptional regulator n=1 Tax=Desertibacillus haloalkaliphilus TaxID=1328930 RepID=UPI001C2533CB|nr:sigma-54 dependent transcriptional regulator [Desertibacillus haloalkaliphilus]MBU8906592.1 sigma-54 dependent transcriptional regulator [Desertibacillus haloalkaliphilus]